MSIEKKEGRRRLGYLCAMEAERQRVGDSLELGILSDVRQRVGGWVGGYF